MTPSALAQRQADLHGLTGKARSVVNARLNEALRQAYRAQRRLPSRHALAIRELMRACLLPGPGSGLHDDERRKVRNKLKAMRRAR